MSKQWLNVDLHCHSSLDPEDGDEGTGFVTCSYQEVIDHAKKKGIDVLAFTHHTLLIFSKEMDDYAKKKDIILIPGMEATIDEKHVVILNPSVSKIETFNELKEEKKRNPQCLVLAPHPFYPGKTALKEQLETHIDLFDAIEYCHFYPRMFNTFNKKAQRVAQKHHLPIIGTSDAHLLYPIGKTYCKVFAQRSMHSIIDAIKKGKTKTISHPISLWYTFALISGLLHTISAIRRAFKQKS